MISSSGPLTSNVSISHESSHLSQLPAQLCASLWLALHVPLPPSIASQSSIYVLVMLRGPPCSRLYLTRQHTKTEVDAALLKGHCLLPFAHNQALHLLWGHAMKASSTMRMCEWVLYTGLDGETVTSRQQAEERKSISWDGSLWNFPKNWSALQTNSLAESSGTDKFSTPRVSQIWTRPPAHTSVNNWLHNSD